MSSDDVFKCVSVVIERNKELIENSNNNKNKYQSLYGNNVDIHTTSGDIVDLILKGSMLRQSYDNVTCLLICFKNLLTTDFSFLEKNALNDNNKIRDKYTNQKKDSKNMVYSNSNNDYLKSNNLNNKKNINIHEINKFIQKLKSSGSDSSIFKKREEIVISNETKEYLSKPMMNLYIKTNNKSDKYSSNINDNSSNHNLNLTLGNENKMNEKKGFQVIFKNNKTNNIFQNKEPKMGIKYAKIVNNKNNEEKSNSSEEKKDKIFYNKKKIYFTGFKKNEPSDSKKKEESQNLETNNEKNKNKNTAYVDSRNENLLKDTKSLKLNDYIFSNNNNLSKNKYAHETSYTLGNYNLNNLNKIKGMSSSLKRIYNKDKNKENDKNNFKYIEKEILKKDFENEISNSHFTDIKSQKNDKFNIRTQNNTNQLNLLKNFNDIYQNSYQNKNNLNENKRNNNTSFQKSNPYYSHGIQKIYPSDKRSLNLKDHKGKETNVIIEYNNINKDHHKYFYSKNNNDADIKYGTMNNTLKKIANSKIKYETFSNINDNKYNIHNKDKEPKNTENKKKDYDFNETKNKYSRYLLRSNTESNYYRNKNPQ